LGEILAVIEDGMRRGIPNRSQILKILIDGLFHFPGLLP
jgi:hypothetical protein